VKLRRNSWWQAPRRVSDRIRDRRVTFLELFYDLVYVVIISEVAHRMSTHLDGHGVLVYCGLFTAVWWAWINGAWYHDLHGNDDLRTRVFTFVQMIAVAAMAVFAHAAVGEYSRQFGFAYAALQLVIAFLWLTTGIHDADHRPLALPYSAAVVASSGLFILSGFVPERLRYLLWLVAIVVALAGSQISMAVVARFNPAARAQLDRTREPRESAVERFGLFTIIVLGEVIVGVVRGVIGHHDLAWSVGGIAALGLIVAVGIWWNYFDFVSLVVPRAGSGRTTAWMFIHLPMTAGIAATGAALLNVIEHAPEGPGTVTRLVLVGSIATTLASVAILCSLAGGTASQSRMRRVAGWFMVASATASVGLGFVQMGTLLFLATLAAILLVPVAAGFVVGRVPNQVGDDPPVEAARRRGRLHGRHS